MVIVSALEFVHEKIEVYGILHQLGVYTLLSTLDYAWRVVRIVNSTA